MRRRQRLVWPLVPLHQALQRRVHDLDYLFVELTQRCNLACRHCGSDCTSAADGPQLSPGVILTTLAEIRHRLRPRRLTVALTGGEPLCYPHLFALGRASSTSGSRGGLVTNGWAWDEYAVEAAAAAGMRTVTVSLDGLAAEHDWLRGREGSFTRALRTIELLLAHGGWDAMDVVTCVHGRNLDQLDALHDLLYARGLRDWRLFTISPIGRARDDPELHLDPSQYHRLLDTIRALRARGQLRVALSESGYLGPHHELTVRDAPFFCRAGVSVGGIMADGAILACPNIDRSLAQGNVYRDSFVDVWRRGFALYRDHEWLRTGICRDCGEWRRCRGGPLHLRRPGSVGPVLCHLRGYALDGEHPDERGGRLPREEPAPAADL